MNDPVTLARELLQIDISAIGGNIIVDGVDVLETTRTAQKLARAVIELTAERDAYREENTRFREQAARVKALADRLEKEAADDFDGASGTSVSLVKYETAKAIRAALNGETND